VPCLAKCYAKGKKWLHITTTAVSEHQNAHVVSFGAAGRKSERDRCLAVSEGDPDAGLA
jgi:co-chaperonin GroES (HSP10)